MPTLTDYESHYLVKAVALALEEDVGSGDITADLIPTDTMAAATIVCRDEAVICGQPWVNEVFRQVDPSIELEWQVAEGDTVSPDQLLVTLRGSARSLLTGERPALNFLQTLSGTATTARTYSKLLGDSAIQLLDTRKTLPGLRAAQKYAVRVGGCHNHRIGLFDAFLIKENHIAACGSITAAVTRARQLHPGKEVEVEVETLAEFNEAMAAGADIIMLDNFSASDTATAIARRNADVKIEISGDVTAERIASLRGLDVDRISSGALTKHLRAVDLSMRLRFV